MSFRQQLLRYLVDHPGSDLTAITKGVGLNSGSATDRAMVSARLGMLVHDGRATRTGAHTEGRWTAGSDALVDRRTLRAQERKAAKARLAPKPHAVVAPKLTAQPVLRDRPLPPKPPADCPSRISLVRAFQPAPKQRGSVSSDQLAADVAEFLRRGGRIEQLSAGASSKPLRTVLAEASYTAVNERSWRERERKQRDTLDLQDDDLDQVA